MTTPFGRTCGVLLGSVVTSVTLSASLPAQPPPVPALVGQTRAAKDLWRRLGPPATGPVDPRALCLSFEKTLTLRHPEGEDVARLEPWPAEAMNDLVLNLSPKVPLPVRLRSAVGAYLYAGNPIYSNICVARPYFSNQDRRWVPFSVVVTREFCPPPAVRAIMVRRGQAPPAASYAEAADAYWRWRTAQQLGGWDIDQPGAEFGFPRPGPEFASVSRERSLFHEFIHGVLDGEGDRGHGVVEAFRRLWDGAARGQSTWDELISQNVLTAEQAEHFRQSAGGTTPVAGYDNLTARLDRLHQQQGGYASIETFDAPVTAATRPAWERWLAVRREWAALRRLRGELVRAIGFPQRCPGDAHSYSSPEEHFVIAVELLRYDPDTFRAQVPAGQRKLIEDWWERLMATR